MKDWYFSPLEDSINFPQNTFFIINKKELSDNDLKNIITVRVFSVIK